MTPAEIDSLIARWMAMELEKTEELRDTCHYNADDRDFMAGLVADQYEDAAYTNARNPGYLAPEADALLQAAGLPPLDHATRGFKRLCRKLQLAKLEVLGIEAERWQGMYKTPLTGQAIPAATVTPPPVASSLAFSAVAKKYLAEKARAKRTVHQLEVEFEKFVKAIGGDRPIAQITKTEGRVYKDALLKRGLKPATVAVRIHGLSGLFTWAAKQGYLPEGVTHPIRGLAPDKTDQEKEALVIQPFTDEQLLQVFATPEFYKQRLLHPDRYWVTLICLYQLVRREEAAQLAVKDLGERDGIPFMMITDLGENQSVKNPGSKRTIPIHSSLIALGFLEYIRTVKAQRHTRLFHQAKFIANRYGDAIGKWFGVHLDRVHLSQPELRMHSLRHGIHYLHSLGCPSDIAEMLTGHTASSVHNKYEHRELTKMARLQAGLEKMQFPEVLNALMAQRD